MRRLRNELQYLRRHELPNVVAVPEPSDLFTWHFCLFGLDGPFKDGFYYGRILIPHEYPLRPPNMFFVTPNGRFLVNTKICMSFTSYHPESWSSSWTIDKMLMGMISFMYEKTATFGSVDLPETEVRRLAQESAGFNLALAEFSLFQPYFERMGLHPERYPPPEPVPDQLQPLASPGERGARGRWVFPLLLALILVAYVLLTCLGVL